MIEGYQEFLDLRRWFLNNLRKTDLSCGKRYDGEFELVICYPNIYKYEDDEEINDLVEYYCIKLHCYLIGPHRHYVWAGSTLKETINNCRKDLEQWCKEDIEED